jgi:hypothetical protein
MLSMDTNAVQLLPLRKIFLPFCLLLFCALQVLAQDRIQTQPTTPLATAQAALERRDWAMAESILEPLVKAEPKNPFVYFELAQLYEHTNRTQAAKNIYQAIAAIPAVEKNNYLVLAAKDGKKYTLLLTDLATEKLNSINAADAANNINTPPAPATNTRPPTSAQAAIGQQQPPSTAPSTTTPTLPTAVVSTTNLEGSPPVIAMRKWTDAWQSKNMPAYIASYVPDYKGDMATSVGWQKSRDQRIRNKSKISINVYDVQLKQLSDKEVQLDFSQAYVTDQLTSIAKKTLVMINSGGRWLIAKESTK